MIFAAAALIIGSATRRLFVPSPLEQLGFGLLLSAIATLANLATGMVLLRAGRRYRSITLEADGKHLLTDVWTSVGVLVALGLVALTGWQVLDPLIALLVGANILSHRATVWCAARWWACWTARCRRRRSPWWPTPCTGSARIRAL